MSIPLGVGNYLYTLPGNGFQGMWTFYYILQCHNEPVGFSQSDGSTPKHTYLVNCYIWLFCIATLSYFNISRAYIHCRHRNEAAFTTDRCNPNLEKRQNQKVPNECHFTSLLICISCLEVWWLGAHHKAQVVSNHPGTRQETLLAIGLFSFYTKSIRIKVNSALSGNA